MNTQTIKIFLTSLALVASAACLRAAPINKDTTGTDLTAGASWVGGVAPGPNDVATWPTASALGGALTLSGTPSWLGINITNATADISISGGTLTLVTNGIDMSASVINANISSGLTLGAGSQIWKVATGRNLTTSAFTRSGAQPTLLFDQSPAAGTWTASPSLTNGLIGPWANVRNSGTAANTSANGFTYATVSGGIVVAYTNAIPETTAGAAVSFGGIPAGDNSTVNYDLGAAGTGGSLTNDTYVNTLRNIGGGYIQLGTNNFRANSIMNAGSGFLSISTPIQQADTNLNELVLAAWTSSIALTNGAVISDNVNPLRVTFTGSNVLSTTVASTRGVFIDTQNTFSGGATINGGAVGFRVNSIPTSGAVTSGPFGTGTLTLNGGILYALPGNWAIGNPVVVGPGGGQLQGNGASPDLFINGNITGSGTLILNGVFNQNGLFLNGDNSGFTGTVMVTGNQSSNNRLGTGASGSALAKWVVNGALQARVVGGATYYLGELSSTATTGGLVGWAANTSPAIQIWEVGALNTSSTFSGIFANNAAGNAQTGNSDAAANNVIALTKVGIGTLTLTGTSTATGPVTISAGVLQIGNGSTTGSISALCAIQDNANLTINRNNAIVIGNAIAGFGSFTQAGTGTTTLTNANTYLGDTLVNNGILWVNGSSLGTATVKSGAKLGGNGTISGVVTVEAGGQLGAGTNNIGTLTLNSTPVLGGSVFVEVNAAAAQADRIVVTGGNPINYGGSLVVSNTGVPLLAGDAFTIFTAGSHNGSFASIVGSPGAGLAYTFTNGILSVVSTVATYSTNVTLNVTASVGGTNTLTLAWPPSHSGWLIQAQTNNVDGSITNDPAAWFDFPGSTSVNLLSITNPLNRAVYYRMKYVPPPAPSGAPTILTARATNSAVALTWSAPAFARSYNVKNSTTNGGPYGTVANVIGTSYTNTGLPNGITHYFVVSAVNINGESANSPQTNATPVAVPPGAPTGLAALAAHGLVQLTWTAPTGFPTNYYVKRATVNGGPYSTITNVLAPATTFLDTNVVDGTTYYYVVSGLNIDGEGPNSSQVSALPTATVPAAPTGLAAVGQYTQVRLTWTAAFGVTSYNVKRSAVSGGPYSTFTNVTASTVYDTGLADGVTNYYVVSALNGIGEGVDSAQATATTITNLPLAYDFENTGAAYPAPPLPALGSLPFIQPLPDPFCWANDPTNSLNTRSTNFSDWSHHRAEIKAQVENYEIGYRPSVDPSMITASVSGSGTTRTLTVIVTNVVSGTNRTLTLTSAIGLPAASGTFPAIIGMNSANGSISLNGRAIATVNFQHNQVTTYGSQLATDPYYLMYAAPYSPALDVFNTGQYSAWSWGVSRLMDGLYKLNGNLGGGVTINLQRIGVTGCSYAGKMALFCGAFDERIALTIPQESGGGGAPTWRYSATEPPGTVEWLPNTDHNWFRESMFTFGTVTNVSYLPHDHHELLAMVVPRALFVNANPTGAVWLSNPSTWVSSKAALRIYQQFGLGDRFGYLLNNGGQGHCASSSVLTANVTLFLDKFLMGSNTVVTTGIEVGTNDAPYIGVNTARWTSWWGTTNAVLGPP